MEITGGRAGALAEQVHPPWPPRPGRRSRPRQSTRNGESERRIPALAASNDAHDIARVRLASREEINAPRRPGHCGDATARMNRMRKEREVLEVPSEPSALGIVAQSHELVVGRPLSKQVKPPGGPGDHRRGRRHVRHVRPERRPACLPRCPSGIRIKPLIVGRSIRTNTKHMNVVGRPCRDTRPGSTLQCTSEVLFVPRPPEYQS